MRELTLPKSPGSAIVLGASHMSFDQSVSSVATALSMAARGDADALNRVLPVIYDELRLVAHRLMKQERAGHTLQTTALVHEAYVRLIDQRNVDVNDRTHFFATASTIIRRILVDYAREHQAAKRGGGWARVTLEGAESPALNHALDVLELEDALEKLAALSERAAKVVTMRYFGGLGMEEIAVALQVSPRTVADDWAMSRAWLRREMTGKTETE